MAVTAASGAGTREQKEARKSPPGMLPLFSATAFFQVKKRKSDQTKSGNNADYHPVKACY
jgi:hypothetical protein